MKDVLDNHLMDPFFHLVHWLSIILYLRRISHASINLERKFYLDCFFGYALYAGRIWKGDMLIADLDELAMMDTSEIYSKRLNAKEVIFFQTRRIYFSNSRWTNQNSLERDQELRTSTLVRLRPIQGDRHIDFLGESEGSLPQPHDSLPDAGEAIHAFWSMSGSITYRHHVEPRVKLYSPREESFPFTQKPELLKRTWMLSRRNALVIGTLMASRELSDP